MTRRRTAAERRGREAGDLGSAPGRPPSAAFEEAKAEGRVACWRGQQAVWSGQAKPNAHLRVIQHFLLSSLIFFLPPSRLIKPRAQLPTPYSTRILGATPTKPKVSCCECNIFSMPSMARATSTLTFWTWMSSVRMRVPPTAERMGDYDKSKGQTSRGEWREESHLDVLLPRFENRCEVSFADSLAELSQLNFRHLVLIASEVEDHSLETLQQR